MHELGTVLYIMKTVEKLAEENELTDIASVTLEVGEVSSMIPSYLTDFWDYARKKSELLANTELKIEIIPAVTWCDDCKKTYATVPQGKTCPYCEGGNTWLLQGNEYNIKEIEAM